MYEMLKNILGPSARDPRKLLAHVWIIRDEDTEVAAKLEHPWVMIGTKHPADLIYQACLVSTKKRSDELSCYLRPGIIGEGRWGLAAYVKIAVMHLLPETVIDKGDHKCDLPDELKQEILFNLSRLRDRRYRK